MGAIMPSFTELRGGLNEQRGRGGLFWDLLPQPLQGLQGHLQTPFHVPDFET